MTGALIESLRGNDLLAGGFVLLLLGSATGLAFRLTPRVISFLVQRFTVTLETREQEILHRLRV